MKKIKYIIVFLVILFLATPNANAASISTSASTVYPGQSFTASVTIYAASWNVHSSVSGPVSGCIMNEANASDTALNITKQVTTTCTATGVGTITISLSGDYTTEDGNNSALSGSTTVQVVEQPAPPAPKPQPSQPKPQIQQPQKSSNNFLKSLSVSGCTISPKFDKNVMDYSCKDLLIDKVDISAKVEDSKASITGTGTKKLNNGDNNFEVSVTSESGQVRVYKLLINKKNIPSTKILNINLGGKDYEINNEIILFGVPSGTKKFDLKIKTESITAKVNITGNDNLKPGNNVIDILVTDTNCKEKTYKVLVYVPEKGILKNQDIKALDKDYIVNLNKNSAYILNKSLLNLIGTHKIKYNIIDKNSGLLSSIELSNKQELENDYELYFIVNKNKIYTNIFKNAQVQAYIGNQFKQNEKLYIYGYDETKEKYKLISEQKYKDFYVSFKTIDAYEYLITNNPIVDPKNEEKKISTTELILVVTFQVVIMIIIILLFTLRIKNNYKIKYESNAYVQNSISTDNQTSTPKEMKVIEQKTNNEKNDKEEKK